MSQPAARLKEARRRARRAARALVEPPPPPPAAEDLGEEFTRGYTRTAPFTMTSRERMFALWQAARYVAHAHVPGDIVECGVWRGGSAMLAALALLEAGDHRHLWLYDTYEGMTPPSDRDRRWTGESAAERLATHERRAGAFNDWAFATLDDVERQMASVGYPSDLLHFVKGPVEQTIPDRSPESISLLRLGHRLVRVHPSRTGAPVAPPEPRRRAHHR